MCEVGDAAGSVATISIGEIAGPRCDTAACEEDLMNVKPRNLNVTGLKIAIAVSAFVVIPALARAQTPPTKADAQKVVQMITGDKAKMAAYCDIAKLEDQMAQLDEKKDQKKAEELSKQADTLGQKIGPDYVKLMAGLEQVDPDSKEGKDLSAVFEPLDKQCAKK